MQLANATVLVTGANRGLGLAFAREALARGARKVYAGARDPSTVTQPGVEAIRPRPSQSARVDSTCRTMTERAASGSGRATARRRRWRKRRRC